MKSNIEKIYMKNYFLACIYFGVYILVGMAAFIFFKGIYLNNVYMADDLIYRIAQYVEMTLPLLVGIYIFVGIAVILRIVIKKPFLYVNDFSEAVEMITKKDDEIITINKDLPELEQKLNSIKFSIQSNERIAKEAEQRKNDLVVYLAHDLKTPLTSVIGYLSLLRDEKEISEELREKYLAIACDKSERLEELINEFFEITRFNLSKITLEYSTVDLKLLLEQLIFEFGPMLNDKNLSCRLHMSEKSNIMCDVDKMQRVFDNLLKNAISYSFENSQIDIYVDEDESYFVIEVVNKGNDIPKEKLNRLFEQFYRLDSSRGTARGGAGLGLAISKEIVELHGGTIEAKSKNEIITMRVAIPKKPM